ncbi:MAG: HAMP domain-containing histidine kinase [Bacillota bacterium]|nr:HAMP domain-containing histidine kinase [Bacillota bacterium]
MDNGKEEKKVNIKEKMDDMDQYDKSRTESFGNISHEFKTPLNVIISAIQLLELYAENGTIIDPELKLNKYLGTMKQNAFRLLKLSYNMIDLSKIDSNYYDIDLHNYDLAAVVQEIVKSVEIYAETKNINLVFNKEIDSIVMAFDIEKLERIVLNLLSNALKFTKQNGIVKVNLYKKDNYAFISVKDSGIGIAKDKQEMVFERFRQADRSFARKGEGSGIGLSLVKALVNMHNGEINLESEYGEGSEFTVKLPISKLQEDLQIDNYSMYKESLMERLKVEFSDL